MRFALLGADPAALALAEAAVSAPEHDLVWACELGSSAELLESLAPGAALADEWEELLSGSAVQAVIVARGADDDARADQLRKLVQAGMPLIVSHPVHESMLVYYELDMIRQETGCILLPYAPLRWHPALDRIDELLGPNGDAPLGALEQVVIERTLGDRGRRSVLAHFARDIDLARALCGELTQVAAMSSLAVPRQAAPSEAQFATLGVQMSGPAGVLVRWSVGPAEEAERGQALLVGSQGRAVLTIPADGQPWQLQTRQDGVAKTELFERWNAPGLALDRLAQAMAGEEVRPDWLDGAHTMELADAVDHSIGRGRTVEVHYEGSSEHATFKGLMSGIGCFLLIGGLILVVVATTAARLAAPLANTWPYLLLAVLATFLLLQLLKFVFPREESSP